MNLIKSFVRYVFNRTVYRFSRKSFRFIVSFFSIVTILICSLSVSAASVNYEVVFSRPQISGNSCYLEIVLANAGIVVIYVSGYNNPTLTAVQPTSLSFVATVDSGNFLVINNKGGNTFKVGNTSYLLSLTGFYINHDGSVFPLSNRDSSSNLHALWLGNLGSVQAVHGYNCDVSSLPNKFSFTVSYGNENIIGQKLDEIKDALTGGSTPPSYDPPDPEISSGIDSIKQEESKIISGSQDDFDSEVSSGTGSILGFFNSAGQSLIFVKDMFNDLASNNIWFLITCSIMLAILPVLLGVFRGLGK